MKTRTLVAAAGIFALSMGISSQVYAMNPSQAPSWMPMTMLNVSFDQATMKLDVVDRVAPIPLFTNTLPMGTGTVRDPGMANFDPTKPWYVAQDTAFSRQLGWDDQTATHGSGVHAPGLLISQTIQPLYGQGAGIWIEETASSPGLQTYFADGMWGFGGETRSQYSTTDPITGLPVPVIYPGNWYSGIFGTDGSPAMWQWDGSMIHNLYTMPWNFFSTPNEVFFATYKVYVGDARGNEILNQDGSSAATYETWKWQGPADVPVPEPSTFVLLGAGLLSAVILKRKRS